MFIETYTDEIAGVDQILTFIKSSNIQAYPCGRRRAVEDRDLNDNDIVEADEHIRIPFDPEARLNTEANNRKHSSLNGYTQTYLKEWDEKKKLLTVALAGYLFNITLTDNRRKTRR